MSRMHLLNMLKPGQVNFDGYCLVRSCSVKTNVKGAAYLDLVLADGEGEALAKKWDYDAIRDGGSYESEDVVYVSGLITEFKGTEQLKLDKIRRVTAEDEGKYSLGDLIPCSPYDPKWIFDELYAKTEAFQDEELKKLVQYLLNENKEALLKCPAAVKLHHATRGGLMQHCWEIVSMAESVIKVYPALDPDLIYAGAILHDIGKLREYDTGKLGIASGYSEAGQLLGHINMGVSLMEETGHKLGLSEETILLMQHMLLSHHGQPEFGSPKQPMFPEAEVLSTLDQLSCHLFIMYDALDAVQPGAFTDRIWSLDNRMLYRRKGAAADVVAAEPESTALDEPASDAQMANLMAHFGSKASH